MNNVIKYSIIIPARNGGKYLQSCIETIINTDYSNYELIISDDHSTDGTKEYLSVFDNHPNVKVIEPENSLSMTEHWEWALSHAIGEWQIFVGQDDGLQPYFFKLADELTNFAKEKNIRAIMSSRAYYFWDGCEPVYGDNAVNFFGRKKIKVHNCFIEVSKALFGFQDYFELPEMYTTSLFHKSLISEAKEKQYGNVLTCHPQDANLGVIATSLEKNYIKSYLPLGWVGSSPKSAGMAMGAKNKGFKDENAQVLKELEYEYTEKLKNSKFQYNKLAGAFSFGDSSIYFWQAFLETPLLRSKKVNNIFISKLFKYVLFSSTQVKFWTKRLSSNKTDEFKSILIKNKCSLPIIKFYSVFFLLLYFIFKTGGLFMRLINKFKKVTSKSILHVYFNRSENPNMTMQMASEIVMKRAKKIL